MSGEYSTTDMVNRLEPVGFRWMESSIAEQQFLGWTTAELRQKSFLDILHSDDRSAARDTLNQAVVRGEALGLVVRIVTADGKTRNVEVNIGARYGTNQRVTHLRCHLSDVTEQVRAERELRLRTQELTQVNEQLRRINRELEDLKDRYSDLYEHAPAMYFGLDLKGNVVECNQTMLSTLKKNRSDIIGHPYRELLHRPAAAFDPAQFDDLLEKGSLEKETCWAKSDGEGIAVWVLGSLVLGFKGSSTHSRFVAQDVTAEKRLGAQLREKNERLAQANEGLSRKNLELDEFVHVVSHDLQEPLRTLIAFSDFLLRDYGDRLNTEGQEFVRFIVDASRRMRAMIHDLLNLSRAGKVIGGFAEVDLEDLVAVIRTDLGDLIRRRQAQVRITGPLPVVWGDRDRLAQLLSNLITNGLKYNQSPEPRVEIGAVTPTGADPNEEGLPSHQGEEATIWVKDNGIGIDPQFHATIFQLFRRLHTREEYEGTGAGLAICNKIVEAHGGRVWVVSAPGEGATFHIRLRCRPPAPSLSNLEQTASSLPMHSQTTI
jgi:PAS domain S-box-containing protein